MTTNKPRAMLMLIQMHHEQLDDNPILRVADYWEHLEADVIEHLPEALQQEANNPECHETLAHETIYEFNLLASHMGVNRVIDISQARNEPDPSWNREIAHQAGMGGLSATDYLGEE